MALLLAHARHCAAQRVFADDFFHAWHLLAQRIAAQARDVGVALVPGQDRLQPSAQHIAFVRRVGAAVAQGVTVDPGFAAAGGSQEFGEERQLRVRGCAGRVVPLHMDSTSRCVQGHGLQGLRQHRSFAPFCVTRLVTPANWLKLAPSAACSRVSWLQLPGIGSFFVHGQGNGSSRRLSFASAAFPWQAQGVLMPAVLITRVQRASSLLTNSV